MDGVSNETLIDSLKSIAFPKFSATRALSCFKLLTDNKALCLPESLLWKVSNLCFRSADEPISFFVRRIAPFKEQAS